MTGTPDEVRRWLSEISQRRKEKRGGRKIEHDDEKHTKAREYMRAYRERKRKEKNDDRFLQTNDGSGSQPD